MTDKLIQAAQQALNALQGLFPFSDQPAAGVAAWNLNGSVAPLEAFIALSTQLKQHQATQEESKCSPFNAAQQEQKPVGQLQEVVYGRGQVLWFNKPADKAMLYTDPPVAYDKTEMNSFVIDLYDEKMKEGKHGHYEALFHCVHQAIKRAAHGIKEQS
jgi:hypothetical protein